MNELRSMPVRRPDFAINIGSHILDGWQEQDHFVIKGILKDGTEIVVAISETKTEEKLQEAKQAILLKIAEHFLQ